MKMAFFFLSLIFLYQSFASVGVKIKDETLKKEVIKSFSLFYTPSEGLLENLFQGEMVALGQVETPSSKKTQVSLQSLFVFVAGLHPQKCQRAMRKLSLYENYKDYVDYIKKSQYDEKKQRLFFKIDHALLPTPFILDFKLPRITDEGRYKFVFEKGFLKNLQGDILLQNIGSSCLMALKTSWTGPQTPIPNILLSTFAQTVSKVGLEHLIRVSRF